MATISARREIQQEIMDAPISTRDFMRSAGAGLARVKRPPPISASDAITWRTIAALAGRQGCAK